MKFGEKLQADTFAPWRLSYIQYDVLKSELKTRQLDHEWSEQDTYDFVQLLENELEKVYDFVTAKLNEVEARISYCERTLKTFMNHPTWSSEQNWKIMDDALTEVLFDVNDLAKFTRLNYIGFQKIIKKHDKWTGLHLQQDFVPYLRARPLDKQRFDVAIVFISALHDLCRRQGKPRTGNAAAGGDQNAFERATAKYWIHPDNVTEVKSIIMLHLPVLIFNKDKRYEPSDSAISSVYFDNEDFDLYTGRLQRDEAAEAIRFRWYGPMSSNAVFIERKTHHAPWLNGASVKDRFRLHVDQVPKYMSGELTADTYAKELRDESLAKGMDSTLVETLVRDNHFVADGVQRSLDEKQLQPILRAFYNRTAFQLPGDQRVRVSLDTDLTFVREDNLDGTTRRQLSDEWRRKDMGIDYPFSYLPDDDVLRFPYAVLETKLQTHLGQKPPEWLTKLVDSHLVHEVPRFSKYLHGACYFHRDRMPLLPWWLSEMELDIRKPRATDFGLTRSRSYKPLIDGQYSLAMEREEERMNLVAKRANSTSRSTRQASLSQAGASRTANYPTLSQLSANNTLIDSHDFTPEMNQNRSLYSQGSFANSKDSLWQQKEQKGQKNTPRRKQKRMSPQIIVSSEVPLDYGPNGIYAHQEQPEYTEKGSEVHPDMLIDMEDDEAKTTESRPKTWRRFFGGGDPHMVNDPNNKGELIPLKKVKVEPKVFFANERTFISWLQFCALLLTVALSLLNFGDDVSRIAGGIFIGIAAVVAVYALYRFEKRAWMINRRVIGRYDDLWGPAVLCVLLVGALVVNFYLRFR